MPTGINGLILFWGVGESASGKFQPPCKRAYTHRWFIKGSILLSILKFQPPCKKYTLGKYITKYTWVSTSMQKVYTWEVYC